MKKFIVLITLALSFISTSYAGGWHLAYSHDENGNALEGSYEQLKKDFLNGASIRMLINNKQMINPRYCKISEDNTYFVCQANWHGANDKLLIKEVKGVSLYTTQGERTFQAYNTNGAFLYELNQNNSIKWFTDI